MLILFASISYYARSCGFEVNKELYAGEMKVLEIKDLSMFREFDFVQLQGQENGLPALFMQFAEHYKEKL